MQTPFHPMRWLFGTLLYQILVSTLAAIALLLFVH
jgi:hypothetical protein